MGNVKGVGVLWIREGGLGWFLEGNFDLLAVC